MVFSDVCWLQSTESAGHRVGFLPRRARRDIPGSLFWSRDLGCSPSPCRSCWNCRILWLFGTFPFRRGASACRWRDSLTTKRLMLKCWSLLKTGVWQRGLPWWSGCMRLQIKFFIDIFVNSLIKCGRSCTPPITAAVGRDLIISAVNVQNVMFPQTSLIALAEWSARLPICSFSSFRQAVLACSCSFRHCARWVLIYHYRKAAPRNSSMKEFCVHCTVHVLYIETATSDVVISWYLMWYLQIGHQDIIGSHKCIWVYISVTSNASLQ